MAESARKRQNELCEPGMHSWVIGRLVGEHCSHCGWSRDEYELETGDFSRDVLRRYSSEQPVARRAIELAAADTDPEPEPAAEHRGARDTEPGW